MPNSSASISVSTSAAQLIATKGTPPAATQLVNLPRDQFLAGPALAFDQDGEIRGRNSFDTLAQALHHQTRADERRSAITCGPCAVIVPARESFGLENQRGEACRRFEQLTTPVVDAAVTGKRRFEHQLSRGVRRWNRAGDIVARANGLADANGRRARQLVEPHRLGGHQLPHSTEQHRFHVEA